MCGVCGVGGVWCEIGGVCVSVWSGVCVACVVCVVCVWGVWVWG